jgi:hypothetical protein
MAVPTGTASMLDIQNEFGGSAPISLSEYYGAAAGVPASGTISINDFRGKSSAFYASITTHQQQLNLRSWAVSVGWNQSSNAVITVNSGVYLWSDNTGVAGLTIDGSWPAGLTLVNYGYIIGKGGNGRGYYVYPTSGGPALNMYSGSVTIQNQSGGYIAGGGGGGGGRVTNIRYGGGGGGAGGGAGGSGWGQAGGAGGAIGQAGSHGSGIDSVSNGKGGGAGGGGGNPDGGGGGGGRLPSNAYGGAGGGYYYYGGGGGYYNNAGGTGRMDNDYGGGNGGGGFGANGGTSSFNAGGSGGKAINANQGYTLSNSGTIWGAT